VHKWRLNKGWRTLTVSGHAEAKAFLQPAVLASIPVDAVYDAVLVAGTLVVDDGALTTPKEALAPLTRYHSIVHAGTLVAAHLARDDLDLGCNTQSAKTRQFGVIST
jgi:hypothetical protein